MRISDWSSDVCSSDLPEVGTLRSDPLQERANRQRRAARLDGPDFRLQCLLQLGTVDQQRPGQARHQQRRRAQQEQRQVDAAQAAIQHDAVPAQKVMSVPSQNTRPSLPSSFTDRSEEHTSELQSLMRISYDVFCLKKKKKKKKKTNN